jgi:GntR family transcriptional repressor for pyruvate dehydrogenase complex
MADVKFEPVERRTISWEVRERLARSIREGQLLPGHQVPSERALCQQFEVARTSVREAIQGLVSLGVLERRGNRTFVVEALPDLIFDVDGSDRRKQRVRELFEVRRVVEVPIVRLAACRATDEDRARLTELAGRFHADMRLDTFRKLDHDFHRAIARACGNATLLELYGKVLDSLFRSSEFEQLLAGRANRDVVRDVITGAAQSHRQVAKAIENGDWPDAVATAEAHLDHVEEQMIARMA